MLAHGRSLTTNHLLTKGNVWLTPILAAHQKTPRTAQKPQIYDLLSRLNGAFVRVYHAMAALEQVGIFDPLMEL